jgi:MYXO-CTERM domain-containing protein
LGDRRFRVAQYDYDSLEVTGTPAGLDTPEPASATLALLGLAAAGVARYRRRRAVCA